MIEANAQLAQSNLSLNFQTLLKYYQQSIVSIIGQFRVIVHNIHEESGNPLEDIKLYINDIKEKMKQSQTQIKYQHEQNKQKSEEVSKLKLQIKSIQNDYSEMKSSLFLEVQEQKLIVNRMREELNHQKQLQQAAINQFVTDIERKNQQLLFLKQDYEEQLDELKLRLEGISLSSIKSYQQIEEEQEKQKLRISEIESQRQKTITNYTELITKQRQQIKTLLLRLKESNQGEQNKQIISMIEHQSNLMTKIQQLQANIMTKDQQISKISTISKSQNRKCRQYYQKLRMKEQQTEDLKSKVSRYTRDSTIRQTQIAELRTTLQKVVKQRQQSSKYMGTKWEHQIDRVLLNAQLQFDRQKNRLKKAAQQRQQQIQDQLNQKINKLKIQVKGLKQNKTKLIDKVKELQEKIKFQSNQATTKIDKLKQQLADVTNARNILMQQLQVMTNKYQTTLNSLKQAEKQKLLAQKQLNDYKDKFQANKKKIQQECVMKIQSVKKQVQQQKSKLTEKSKLQHTKLVNNFHQKQKKLNLQIQQKLKSKEKSLVLVVENIKRQQEDNIKLKLIQIQQIKQQTQKQLQKSIKSVKKQYVQLSQQNNKIKIKLEKQLKQIQQILTTKEQQITKLKLKVQELSIEIKNKTNTLIATTQQKDKLITLKQSIIQAKIQQYNTLFEEKCSIDKSYKQLLNKYGYVRGEINQIKDNTVKEINLLVEHHDKMIKGYRSYIRQLEDNCFTHSDIMVYVREIRKLRQVNTQAETDLANMESKLLTMKQVSKYQVTKMEESIKSDKFDSTMRSLTRAGNSQGSLTRKSVQNGQKFARMNIQHKNSGYTHYGSIDNLQGGMNNNFNGQFSNNNGYQKLSKHKKRLGTAYQRSRMKKSRVGFTEIDTYSILSNSKQQFRFNALTSPEGVRYVRSALNK